MVASFRRLSLALTVALVMWLLPCAATLAQGCQAYSYYMASCQASLATKPSQNASGQALTYTCEDVDPGNQTYADIMLVQTNTVTGLRSDLGHAKGYMCASGNPCTGQADMNGAFAGNLSAGASLCARQSDGVTGCAMTFTPDSPPFLNRAGTQWGTHGTYKKTGSRCNVSGANSPPPPVPPKSCGGVSCYDSAGDKFCSVNAQGVQNCVSGKDARKPGGACASNGDVTTCAGSPQPPKPPPPPQSPISDPPTETKGSDSYTQGSNGAGGTTAGGGNTTTTTTTYGAGGAPSTSGQGSGDDGPAKPSSSGTPGGDGGGDGDKGDKTGASGGGDCNNPPFVEGSPALGMIALQTWHVRCDLVNEKVDDSDKSIPGASDIPDGTKPEDSPVHDVTAFGADKLDSSGFLGGSDRCPSFPPIDIPQFDVHYSGPPPGWCEIVGVIGKLVMLMAIVWSYMILMRR